MAINVEPIVRVTAAEKRQDGYVTEDKLNDMISLELNAIYSVIKETRGLSYKQIHFPLSISFDDFYYLPEYAKSDIKHAVLLDLYKSGYYAKFSTRDDIVLSEINKYLYISWKTNDISKDEDFLMEGYRKELEYIVATTSPTRYDYSYYPFPDNIWKDDSNSFFTTLHYKKFLVSKQAIIKIEFSSNGKDFNIYRTTPRDNTIKLTGSELKKFKPMAIKIKKVLDLINYLKGNE